MSLQCAIFLSAAQLDFCRLWELEGLGARWRRGEGRVRQIRGCEWLLSPVIITLIVFDQNKCTLQKHCVIVWMHYAFVVTSRSFVFQMIQEMASSNKGEAPDMGDLSDVSAVCSFCLKCNMSNNHQWQELLVVGFMNYVLMFIIWMFILMFICFLLLQSDWSFLSSVFEEDVTVSHVVFKSVCNIFCKISCIKNFF